MPLENHTIVIGIIVSLIVILIAVGLVAILLSLSRRKAQLYTQEKENMQLQFEAQLLKVQLEMQEQTLQEISRELHDNFGQVASLIKINLQSMRLNDPPVAAQQLEEVTSLTKELLRDIKSLAESLNSDNIVRTGLPAAIQQELDRLNRMQLVKASFEQEGEFPELAAEQLIILFRMCQELLNNMLKYSGASTFRIQLTATQQQLCLSFYDNGKGFDIAESLAKGGSGLSNLRKRATLLKATLCIESTPGNGVSTTIQLPLQDIALRK